MTDRQTPTAAQADVLAVLANGGRLHVTSSRRGAIVYHVEHVKDRSPRALQWEEIRAVTFYALHGRGWLDAGEMVMGYGRRYSIAPAGQEALEAYRAKVARRRPQPTEPVGHTPPVDTYDPHGWC